MRSYEWLFSNEIAPSTSATAMMCWQFTSGIARLLTIARAVVGQPHDDALDVVGGEAVLASQRQERVERRLNRIADRRTS